MRVDVVVYCKNCESDEDGNGPEMKGSENIWVSTYGPPNQSRLFVCPLCGNHVSVTLTLKRD